MELAELVKINRVEHVNLTGPHNFTLEGTLCITGHYIMVSSDSGADFCMLHKSIYSLDRRQTGAYSQILLKTKDFLIYKLQIPNQEEARLVYQSIELLSNIESVRHSIAFYYTPSFEILEDGWTAFAIKEEFARLLNAGDWRISTANNQFQLCSTYPRELLVPSSATDEHVQEAARFRHGGRFPVLAYFHKIRGACLLRSSQPLVGSNQRRSKGDEALLNAALGPRRRGFILDTRSQQAVKQAQIKGGGVESDQYYPQWRKLFHSMERFQTINNSFQKFIEACQDPTLTTDKWLSKLESSNWLGHLRSLMTGASMVAQCLDRDSYSVLIHGADGLDCSLQITSLAQVILQPDCRTIRGFEALIEREWVQAGHPFAMRCSKSAAGVTKDRAEAPIFLLFLDAVWQIWQQYPSAFEFVDEFLAVIARHVYFSEYGTFICNNERERLNLEVPQKTVSVWSYLNQHSVLASYLNPLYDPCKNEQDMYACWPSVAPQSLYIWQELYQCQLYNPEPLRLMRREISAAKDRQMQAKSVVIKMRRILAGLEREAIQAGVLTSCEPPHTQL